MGTRSLTRVWERGDEGDVLLVQLYRQMDGYPAGHGVDLFSFLDGREVVNGIGVRFDENGERVLDPKMSNGAEDLAAQLVVWFKSDSEVGGVYLYPPRTDLDAGQEYEYDVFVRSHWAKTVDEPVTVKVTSTYDNERFEGGVDEFGVWLNEVA